MIDLNALWSRDLPPGLYHFAVRRKATRFCGDATEQGFCCFYLDGLQIHDKQSFLQACADVMQFPTSFGRNWDALADSMADLSWARADAYILFFDHAEIFAADHTTEWKVARGILAETVQAWAERGVPFYVLLRGTAATEKLPRYP